MDRNKNIGRHSPIVRTSPAARIQNTIKMFSILTAAIITALQIHMENRNLPVMVGSVDARSHVSTAVFNTEMDSFAQKNMNSTHQIDMILEHIRKTKSARSIRSIG